jgi:hypothetical protein
VRPMRANGGPLVYCRYCGRAILSGDGLFELEPLQVDRACVDHYVPF